MNSKLFEDYLAGVPLAHRKALRVLHDTIAATVPEAELATRRGVPAFRYRGRTLVSVGNARHHVSLYIMQGTAITRHAEALKGFDTSRTVVRFRPEHIPKDLVATLVLARAAEIEEGLAG